MSRAIRTVKPCQVRLTSYRRMGVGPQPGLAVDAVAGPGQGELGGDGEPDGGEQQAGDADQKDRENHQVQVGPRAGAA
jgi:hypothetical protein